MRVSHFQFMKANLRPSRRAGRDMAWMNSTIFAYCLAILLIGFVVFLVAIGASGDLHPGDIDRLAGLFVETWRKYLRPEPLERLVYLVAVSVAFPATVIAAAISLKIPKVPRWIMLGIACTVLILFVLLLSDSEFFQNFIQDDRLPNDVMWGTLTLAALLVGTSIHPLYRSSVGFRRLCGRLNFLIILTYVTLCLAVLRLRSPASLFGDIHFEAVYYSITQVMVGKTLLADLPSQYGLYAEILTPVFLVFGYGVSSVVFVFSTLQYVSYIVLIFLVFFGVRSNIIRLICCFSLFFFVGSNWIFLSGRLAKFEYFQIWPIRLMFPAIIMCGFLLVRRRGLRTGDHVILSLLCGLGVLWNADWGIPAWGGLVAVALTRLLLGPACQRSLAARLLIIVGVAPVLVVAAFALFIMYKSGNTADWGNIAKYQQIFFVTGFGMLPLPLTLHPWMVVAGTYLFGVVYGARMIATSRCSVHSDVVLYASVMGIGIFSYYQGRSHDVVLSFVVWPAILIVFILIDQHLRAVRLRLLSQWTTWLAIPPILFGAFLSMQMISGAPFLFGQSVKIVQDLMKEANGRWRDDLEFVEGHVGEAKSAVIIAPGQSLLLGELGLASAVDGPGFVELLLTEDQDRLRRTIMSYDVGPLFIQGDKLGGVPADFRQLLFKYNVHARSRSGLLFLKRRS